MNKTIQLSLLGIVAVGAMFFFVIKGSSIIPQVTVFDQPITSGQIIVSSATAVAPSWLVIQTETNGAPGPVIGYVKINKGENKNVNVKIDASKSTPKLFVMIHEDSGEKDKFDFPDNDMPLIYKNEMVSKLFALK